jgi:polyphosphate kinase
LVKEGKRGQIIIKLNNLQEKKMIEKLYEASQAGVKVNLIVRSICCVIPQVEGWSDNITITRIVDRFLEHSRIFYFHNGGQEEFYLGSADWMNRNIYRRIEVCFPIKDQHLKDQLKKILELQLADNTKASYLDSSLENVRKSAGAGEPAVNAQTSIYQYVSSI